MLVNVQREAERLADPDVRLWARASAIARDAEEAAGYARACGVEAPFTWWACSARGRRPEQGDRWLVASQEGRLLVAVFDGRGSGPVSHAARDDLALRLRNHRDLEMWWDAAIQALRAAGANMSATILLLDAKRGTFTVGHVGNSGLYRAAGLDAQRLTAIHRLGDLRGDSGAVVRAMRGSRWPQPGEALIVGTDGVLDVLGPWHLAAGGLQSFSPAAELVRLALARGSTDNCTAVVVRAAKE